MPNESILYILAFIFVLLAFKDSAVAYGLAMGAVFLTCLMLGSMIAGFLYQSFSLGRGFL